VWRYRRGWSVGLRDGREERTAELILIGE
jgi:hypothetical protein